MYAGTTPTASERIRDARESANLARVLEAERMHDRALDIGRRQLAEAHERRQSIARTIADTRAARTAREYGRSLAGDQPRDYWCWASAGDQLEEHAHDFTATGALLAMFERIGYPLPIVRALEADPALTVAEAIAARPWEVV